MNSLESFPNFKILFTIIEFHNTRAQPGSEHWQRPRTDNVRLTFVYFCAWYIQAPSPPTHTHTLRPTLCVR